MSVERNLPLIRERRAAILAGNAERIAKQRESGKLTARDRIALLLDQDSFVELDALAACGSGVVTGYGLIDGRPVYLYAQDFTVKAGAMGVGQAAKVLKVLGLAEKTGVPVIALFDSAGARLDQGMEAVSAYAKIMARSAELSGVVPQVGLVLGVCGGGAAMCAALCDVLIMSENGRLFINGPQVVESATGKRQDLNELAGPKASAASGIAQIVCENDEDALRAAATLIGLLPQNNLEDAPFAFDQDDDANREIPELNQIDRVGDVRELMAQLADQDEFYELSENYAPEMVTALARIAGDTVGFVGTQPGIDEGRLTVNGSMKAARFVQMCDCFSIPVVTIADTQGAAINSRPQGELARALARLMYAYAESTSPRVALVTGSAIGTGAAVLCSRASADMVYAWPGSVISPMGAAAAVQLLYKEELHAAADPIAKRAALEADYQANVADGLNAAQAGLVDDVIEPALTRRTLAAALFMLAGKRESKPAKKHGNLPL